MGHILALAGIVLGVLLACLGLQGRHAAVGIAGKPIACPACAALIAQDSAACPSCQADLRAGAPALAVGEQLEDLGRERRQQRTTATFFLVAAAVIFAAAALAVYLPR